MNEVLGQARHASLDPPQVARPTVAWLDYSGFPGRPRLDIDPEFLENALRDRGPTALAAVFNCNRRTIQRRAVEYGIREPCGPVIRNVHGDNGQIVARIHTSYTRPVSVLLDDELDAHLLEILTRFRNHGREMLRSVFHNLGHNVPMARIEASYLRVRGAPGRFGKRVLEPRKYKVPGPMSLVHHDGQHGSFAVELCV